MLATLAGIVMEVKAVYWNAYCPMLVNWDPASNITELKLVEYRNAKSSILVTLAGIVMEVKFVADWNALDPMLVKLELGSNVTEVKLDLAWNAFDPMLVTIIPIETLTKDCPLGIL